MGEENSTERFSKSRTGLLMVLAIVEAILFGFILDGWPAFVYIFKTDRVFEYLCVPDNETDINIGSKIANISNMYEVWTWANEHFANGSNIYQASLPDWEFDDAQFYHCAAQNNLFNSAVFFANFIAQGLSLFFGYLFDRYGLCVSRILTTVFFLTGVLMLTFRNLAYSWFVFIGATLVALAGDMVIITSSHVALLVPHMQTTFIAMVCASVDLSAFVPALIQFWSAMERFNLATKVSCTDLTSTSTSACVGVEVLAYIGGFSRANCLYVYAGAWAIHIFNTAFVSPFFKIYADRDTAINPDPPEKAVTYQTDKDELIIPNEDPETPVVKPFIHYATRPLYILHTLWISLVQLRFWFVVGSFNAWLELVTDMDHEKVTYYVLVYEFLHFLAIPFAVGLGILTDLQTRFHNKKKKENEKKAFFEKENEKNALLEKPPLDVTWKKAMYVLPNLTMAVLSALFISVWSLIWTPSSAVIVSIFTVALKAIMYMAHVDFCQKVYPPEHYGKAYGLSMTIGCLFDLVEVPLFSWAQAASPPFRDASITLLALNVVALAHPITIWFMNRKQ